jgi:TRAP-type C4-dicarboxylate transport system permease small subunit
MVFKALVFPEWWLNLPLLFGASMLALEFLRRLISRPVEQGV